MTTPYELVLRGASVEGVNQRLVDERTRWWSVNTLRVRRDGTVAARFLSTNAPTLRAAVVDDAAGVRITGRLRWTRQLSQVAFCAIAAVIGCTSALTSDSSRLFHAAFGAWFALILVVTIITSGSVREHEEARMTSRLQERLGRAPDASVPENAKTRPLSTGEATTTGLGDTTT